MSYLLRPHRPHTCDLPLDAGHRPADPLGTVWQCDVPVCLRVWMVTNPEAYGDAWELLSPRRARRVLRRAHISGDPS